MIGTLLITHATLGDSLIQCACHVLDERPPQVAQIGVAAQDDPDQVLPVAKSLRDSVDTGDGVLVLTDIYGATPSNIATKLLDPGKTEVVAGVNVPMLLRVLTYRENDLSALARRAATGGCDGVVRITPD